MNFLSNFDFLQPTLKKRLNAHAVPSCRLKVATALAVLAVVFVINAAQPTEVGAWQDNPFGGSATPSPTSPAAEATIGEGKFDVFEVTNDNARSEMGLVVRSVRMSQPESPSDLVGAIETLSDVGAIGDARFYLNKLVNKNLPPQQLFDLYQERGTEFFYQLHANDELAPLGREFVKQVFSAAKAYAVSPQRVDQLVKLLSDERIDIRSRALSQLKRIGSPAYAAMLEVFADQGRQAEFDGVRGGLQRLDDDATKVLIAGARSANPQIQAESYVALTKLRSEPALEFVSYLYLSPTSSASVKQLAENTLNRVYGSIDSEQLYNDIAEDARMSLKVMETSFDSEGTVEDWVFDRETKKFVRSQISTALAAKRRAAFQGELLYGIQPQSTFNRELFILTQLESAKRTAGPDDVVNAKALLKKFGNPQPYELNALLKRAMQLKLMPAAIAICELIKQQSDLASLQTGSRSQLIEAILHGDRHLQFAALDAVIAIDPKASYPGSSHVLAMAAFLAQTQGTEKVIVGHLLGPSSQSYATIVAGSGLTVTSARNGREFYNSAISGPDFELFVVTESLARPGAVELVQLLRRDWRTRHVPIAFVGSDSARLSRMQILAQSDPLLQTLELNFDSRLVSSQLNRIRSLSSSWPVSSASRLLHGQVAAQWMAKIVSERESYGFYQIRKHEEAIYQLLASNGNTEQACQMIAKLGTATSQQTLANFAGQSGYSAPQRQIAADSFAESVAQFGTLLTTEEIRQQYDRYNASESQPAEVQKLMGTILDAIERRSSGNK